jgi:hypothetical protein
LAAIGLVLLLAGCAARVGAPPALPSRSWPGADAPPFLLTFWCGPPLDQLDDQRAAQIAAAGFNLIGAPCEGPTDVSANLAALAVAERHGLRLLVADHRFEPAAVEVEGWEQPLVQAVDQYRSHPAIGGYFVFDEPNADQFEAVGAVVAELRKADPRHLAYVNLLPDYVVPRDLRAESYEEYVERFITEVHPQLLSFDYYPFGRRRDRSTFFANLAVIRAAALRHHLPFLLVALATPHGPYRNPNRAELAWQLNHALAFGARGFSYFTYWTPPPGREKFRNGLIAGGRRTLHYYQAMALNRQALHIAAQLTDFQSLAVADARAEIGPGFPIGPIRSLGAEPITVGLFTAADGRLAALLVNRDYRYGTWARLQLNTDALPPRVFDADRGTWRKATELRWLLPPGGALLLRWE